MSDPIPDTIEQALKVRNPGLTAAFASGATLGAINDAEHELNVTFPDQFKSFLLKSNGQSLDERGMLLGIPVIPPLAFGPDPNDRCTWGEFLSLARVVQSTKGHRQLAAYDPAPEYCALHGPVTLHRNHIIFCDPGSGDCIGIDLNPPSNGSAGQIVAINHDPLSVAYLCSTFNEFLLLVADAIASDDFVFSNEDENFVPTSDL
jgi:cell wall assembly regulator SMI1